MPILHPPQSIFRQRLVTARRPDLQRVAHLPCEQLIRFAIDKGGIPPSRIEIADAGGLSVVHANRIFQELRERGVLSKQRLIDVVDRDRLQELAGFDGRYFDSSESWSLAALVPVSTGDLRIDDRVRPVS